jgi:hypothetical protein
MNHYRQSIVLFGIALPALAIVLALIAVWSVRSHMFSSFSKKQSLFGNYQADYSKAMQVEANIARQRPHVQRWTQIISEEAASSVNNHLRTISENLPAKEFQKTAFERTAGKGGLGANAAQNSSQLRIIFRGTYRTMQRAFLQLESRMPQLQLQEMRIEPNLNPQNPSPLLNFQVTYTAWEK